MILLFKQKKIYPFSSTFSNETSTFFFDEYKERKIDVQLKEFEIKIFVFFFIVLSLSSLITNMMVTKDLYGR